VVRGRAAPAKMSAWWWGDTRGDVVPAGGDREVVGVGDLGQRGEPTRDTGRPCLRRPARPAPGGTTAVARRSLVSRGLRRTLGGHGTQDKARQLPSQPKSTFFRTTEVGLAQTISPCDPHELRLSRSPLVRMSAWTASWHQDLDALCDPRTPPGSASPVPVGCRCPPPLPRAAGWLATP